ncbi:MAG: prepilin-type N-terminal cleavage/methylation domain-containing protein [Casimicrobiaceae bacterium]
MSPRHCKRRARGFTLIEVLIALIILAFGMLALARAMGSASLDELESYQRAQAMVITQEMVERINANRKQALLYVGDYSVPPARMDCAVELTVVARDQCEFRNRLLGTDTLDGVRAMGAPIAARACITETAPGSNTYNVAVAWQGAKSTAAPDSPCGEAGFDSELKRRVFSTVLQIATLGA